MGSFREAVGISGLTDPHPSWPSNPDLEVDREFSTDLRKPDVGDAILLRELRPSASPRPLHQVISIPQLVVHHPSITSFIRWSTDCRASCECPTTPPIALRARLCIGEQSYERDRHCGFALAEHLPYGTSFHRPDQLGRHCAPLPAAVRFASRLPLVPYLDASCFVVKVLRSSHGRCHKTSDPRRRTRHSACHSPVPRDKQVVDQFFRIRKSTV